MSQLSRPAILCALMISLGFASPCSATLFSAEATVFGTSNTIPRTSDSQAGTSAVAALTGTTDPNQPGTNGAAGATSAQGTVSGTSVTNSQGQRLIGFAKASATFDDVLFSWTGPGEAPASTVRVGLNYNVTFEQTASGPLGTQNGRNYRTLAASVGFGSQTESLSATFDVGGNSVSPGIGNRTLSADVALGSAVIVALSIEVASAAFMAALPGPTETSMYGQLRVGSVDVSSLSSSPVLLAAPLSRGATPQLAAFGTDPSLVVFDLPEGYTANSVSMGVVDNVWIAGQVPEPATVVTMLTGLMALGAFRRRARRS